MGKRLVKNEGDIRKRMMFPNRYDILGIVVKNFGQTRICRVRGKMKKRRWVREGDIVLISPWDFQSDEKGDIIFRYTQNQAHWLRQNNYLKIDE